MNREPLASSKPSMTRRNGAGIASLFAVLAIAATAYAQQVTTGARAPELDLDDLNGHRVTIANNGREAVAAAETKAFDLVFMDVQMPEMDGLEATAAIRRREQQTERHVPIIAMTAHAMKGDREKCLEAGASDYLAKPVNTEQLLSSLRMWLHR